MSREKKITVRDERRKSARPPRTARLARSERETEDLARIGVALSSERNLDKLLDLILRKAREFASADAGSLYLVEEDSSGARLLRFKLTQNDSRPFPFVEFTLPLAEDSLAGYTALHGAPVNLPDVYKIPVSAPYRFSDRFDRESGYRTRSLVSLPMKNAKGESLGVLQLINCKRDRAAILDRPAKISEQVKPFAPRSVRLALSLASLAAVAYENSRLYSSIENLFEGFVKASITAIEQRDPTTSGHSFRVSTLTLGLAETVDAASHGPYFATRFTREQMREIRFAALLHDFGKVGVREDVLVKAKKLYPMQLENLRLRFEYIRKELEARYARMKFEALHANRSGDPGDAIAALDAELAQKLNEAAEFFAFIQQANEPALLGATGFERLAEIAHRRFTDSSGAEQPYLRPDEVRYLSIPRGSLDEDERKEIESHVTFSFDFLRQIPWTRELRDVPRIAWAHHEKMDGTGYPGKLRGDEIPLPARMMTICDIFDALNAADRPYKKAVPVDRSLDILGEMNRAGQFDSELFKLFLDARVYDRTAHRP